MVLSSAKLQIFVFSIKIKRSLINMLNNNGPKIEPCGTPLFHTNHYMKSLFLFFASDVIGSY